MDQCWYINAYQLKSIVHLHFLYFYLHFPDPRFYPGSHIPFWWACGIELESNWVTQRSGWWVSCRGQTPWCAPPPINTHFCRFFRLHGVCTLQSTGTRKSLHCSRMSVHNRGPPKHRRPTLRTQAEWEKQGNGSDISDLFNLKRHFRRFKLKQYLRPLCTFQNRKHTYEQKLVIYKEHINETISSSS